MKDNFRSFQLVMILFLMQSCVKLKTNTLFKLKDREDTGLEFQNNLDETAEFNILNYVNYYNGAGVAIGDFNNDGLEDIYFSSNLEKNKLFLNEGGLKFRDVTQKAGVSGKSDWSTGISVADVNGDGWMDIYVSGLGEFEGKHGTNELFINNGIFEGTDEVSFTESASEYGIDVSAFSTQAAFFDYDNDGDLDMYLLNHSFHSVNSYAPRTVMMERSHPEMGDKLFRHDVVDGNHRFVEITKSSGIVSTPIGFGLGVGCGDINQDGWTDLYISNDFHENDYLLINKEGKFFSDELTERIGHTSKYSMGNDIADFNNDGLLDIVTLDMLPYQPEVLQKSMAEDHYDLRDIILKNGYHPQLSRNGLQLNRGGEMFSEIAPLSGIEASDWSWAPLFADLDNDGFKDLYISNGIYRRPNDLDYLNYTSHGAIKTAIGMKVEEVSRKLIEAMPQNPIENFAFRNNGNLTFSDQTEQWGLDIPSHSNGVAYADFDNDGDLDLVLNNINEKVIFFENTASDEATNVPSYLQLQLEGPQFNTTGIGAKALIRHMGKTFYQEQMPVRGFLSSVSHIVHIGLGQLDQIDTLFVIWPGGAYQLLTGVSTRQRMTVKHIDARGNYYDEDVSQTAPKQFFKTSHEIAINYHHRENVFHDAHREFLIPRLVSTEGPGMAIGDVNNDGLKDVFLTNAQGNAARMLIQQKNGEFTVSNRSLFKQDSIHEGVDAEFLDADGDNDLDLLVVSAGNDYREGREELANRLYLNDGSGVFSRAKNAIPQLNANNSCVKPVDYDHDGDIDLFIGGRVIAGSYGQSPKSYLLQNNGQGIFTEAEMPRELKNAGMITDAVWADIDGNGWEDLIVVGEWTSVNIYLNVDGVLSLTKSLMPDNLNGWWNCILADDLDNDGDIDLVAGNVGLNTKLDANAREPVRLYVKDFDENGSLDPVMTCYMQGKEYPFATKDVLSKQMIFLKKKFTNYTSFSGVTIHKMLNSEQLENAEIKEAVEFRSVYFENNGSGQFDAFPLPIEANFSPIMSITSRDLDGDGLKDLVTGGNFYSFTPGMGRQDASYGMILLNKGKGRFIPIGHEESGVKIDGEVREMGWIELANGNMALLVARNNETVVVLELENKSAEI